jgi:hypothetical protein
LSLYSKENHCLDVALIWVISLSIRLFSATFSKWLGIGHQKDPSLPDDPFDTEGCLVLEAGGNDSG